MERLGHSRRPSKYAEPIVAEASRRNAVAARTTGFFGRAFCSVFLSLVSSADKRETRPPYALQAALACKTSKWATG